MPKGDLHVPNYSYITPSFSQLIQLESHIYPGGATKQGPEEYHDNAPLQFPHITVQEAWDIIQLSI
jgi:hypothetical protein